MSKIRPKSDLILVKNQTKIRPDGTSSRTSSTKIRPNPDFYREHALTPPRMRTVRSQLRASEDVQTVILTKNQTFQPKSGPNPDQFPQKSPDPDHGPENRT